MEKGEAAAVAVENGEVGIAEEISIGVELRNLDFVETNRLMIKPTIVGIPLRDLDVTRPTTINIRFRVSAVVFGQINGIPFTINDIGFEIGIREISTDTGTTCSNSI